MLIQAIVSLIEASSHRASSSHQFSLKYGNKCWHCRNMSVMPESSVGTTDRLSKSGWDGYAAQVGRKQASDESFPERS